MSEWNFHDWNYFFSDFDEDGENIVFDLLPNKSCEGAGSKKSLEGFRIGNPNRNPDSFKLGPEKKPSGAKKIYNNIFCENPACRKLFEPRIHKRDSLYCCRKCEPDYKPPVPKETKSKSKICKKCGILFTPVSNNHKYCTDGCNTINRIPKINVSSPKSRINKKKIRAERVRQHGRKRYYKIFKPEIVELFKKMWEEDIPVKEIMTQLNIPHISQVTRWRKRLGLKNRNDMDYRKKIAERKFSYSSPS